MRNLVFAAALLAAPATQAQLKPAAVMANYADVGAAMFGDALTGAKQLQTAIDALLAAPSAETLGRARLAWRAARVPYMQTEGFRFGNPVVDDWEGKVNAWPLDEGLIDYVDTTSYGATSEENPLYGANIIANARLQVGAKLVDATNITPDLLRSLHEAQEVEANVATGYHAVEFLLWGQDLNGTGPGAGNRPATDFDLKSCTGGHCDRRRDYLKAATELLISDLAEMAQSWAKDGEARKAALEGTGDAPLTRILTGLGSLSYGELAGERMKLGVLLHDPEEEHDCFSDNTHNSHYYDQIGMMAIWTGRYDSVAGPGLAALVRERAPEKAAAVDAAMAVSEAALKRIRDEAESGRQAYDQMLASGNSAGNRLVLDAVDALVLQARAVEGVVAALGLTIALEGSDSLDDPTKVKTE